MAITIAYPAGVVTDADKIRFLYRLQEKCRVIHNRVGTWYRDGGVTLAQYNTLLPAVVKNRYPYTPKLSQASWDDFTAWFMRVTGALFQQLNTLCETARNDNTISSDIDASISGN